MDPIVVVFVAINAAAMLLLPRQWAPLPLIVGACYMTRGQALELGVVSLTAVRILVAVGVVRIVLRREWIVGGLNGLDGLMLLWGIWMVGSVVFHSQPESPFVLRVRDLYEAWGLYFLFRVFCQSVEDLKQLAGILALSLVPLAGVMIVEKFTGTNPFAQFGGVFAVSAVRNGVTRAQGPFAHAILAGSIGGVCLPLVAGLWYDRRWLSVIGVAACGAIVMSSGSSGPILAAGAAFFVFMLAPIRHRMRSIRWGAVLAYLALEAVTNRPAYFVIAEVDLTGGSTSWHRAELLRSAFAHLGEWWLVGTDYTRHWMPSGVPSSPTQADITNHYIAMGVVGGLLLMFLLIAIFIKGFWNVGSAVQAKNIGDRWFYPWSVGASLFAHAVTCLSVSYYDHSILFLYLTLAATSVNMTLSPELQVSEAPAAAPTAGGFAGRRLVRPGQRVPSRNVALGSGGTFATAARLPTNDIDAGDYRDNRSDRSNFKLFRPRTRFRS